MTGHAARWAVAALIPAAVACASRAPGRAADARNDEPPIAAVHAHRCGRCHAAPPRGEHTRAQLEDTFKRHRRRTRLTEDEWRAMVEYLAAPEGATAGQPR